MVPERLHSILTPRLTVCTCTLSFRPPKYCWHSTIQKLVKFSINQSNFYSAMSLAKPGSVAQKQNQCSTAKLKKQFHNIILSNCRITYSSVIYGTARQQLALVWHCQNYTAPDSLHWFNCAPEPYLVHEWWLIIHWACIGMYLCRSCKSFYHAQNVSITGGGA